MIGRALALVLAVAGQSPAAAGAEPIDPVELAAFADAYFAQQLSEHRAPGAVFVVVQDGGVRFARGYGAANLASGSAVDPERTLFRVGSVTKLFTATAALQLIEAGRLGLDDDVNEHLASFSVEVPDGEPVRVWHLLTHTPGFDERLIGIGAPVGEPPEPLGAHLARRLPDVVLPPGSVYSYSNYGTTLLGYLIERISGLEYAAYVDTHVLQPLGMRSSGFRAPTESGLELAQGYAWTGEEWRALPGHDLNLAPAGGLLSSGTDMARFMLAHLGRGELAGTRILAAETAALMQRQRFRADPRLAGMALGFHERFENGVRALEHSGDIDGFASLLTLVPTHDVGLFVSYNSSDLILRDRLVGEFLDRFVPAEPEPELAVPDGAGVRAAQIAGSYRVNRYARSTLERLIALQARISADGSGAATLHLPFGIVDPISYREVEPYYFRRVDREGALLFRRDESGEITGAFVELFGIPFVTDRVGRLETLAAQATLVGVALALLLSGCLVWPLAGLRARRRAILTGAADVRAAGRARRWGALAATAAVLFAVAFPVALGRGDLIAGISGEVVATLWLGMLAAALLLPLPVFAVASWRRGWWSTPARIHYTLVAAAGLLFITELWYWNLLGLNY